MVNNSGFEVGLKKMSCFNELIKWMNSLFFMKVILIGNAPTPKELEQSQMFHL